MRDGDPFKQLHEAVAAATFRDLPDIEYWQRDWKAFRALPKEESAKLGPEGGPGKYERRRPTTDEASVIMFPQTWGSTACGYGGMRGSAMTTVYTILVSYGGVSCVYFGCGRLAYHIDHRKQSAKGREQFEADIAKANMAACGYEQRYA